MNDTISRQAAIDAINRICPVDTEYDCTLLDRVDVRCVLSDLPSAQPEQLERCPIYDGVCGYPSDQCYDCPRHHGAQPEQRWIPVTERLPEERDSIFAKLYGTEKWRNAMFRKTSNTVIVTVEFKDGTRQTAPCHTIDGEWNQSIKGTSKVLAWMPLPDPYKNDPCNGCGYLGESCVGEGCGKLTERKEGEVDGER